MAPVGDGAAVVEAVVWTGGEETPYRRAGHGPPVLLLTAGAGADDAEVLLSLAGEFRVIAPGRLPPADAGDEAWGRWLRGVIDGLGLDRPVVAADPAVASTVDRCARHDPGRIRAVVVAGVGGEGALLPAVRVAAHAPTRDD